MKKSALWTIVIVVILVVLTVILMSILKEKQVLTPEEQTKKEVQERTESAREVIPEGSLVTKEGEVITEKGEIVDNTAPAGSPDAPKHSRPLQESEIPKSAIKLSLAKDIGFTPDEFTVKTGSAVTLSLTSNDRPHFFRFKDEDLQGLSFGVTGGQIRAITFNAPEKGDYDFFCDTSGHESETGIMHVE